jgi:rare lipoprotein A
MRGRKGEGGRRKGGHGFAPFLVLLLTACASAPQKPPVDREARAPTPTPAPAPVPQRSGGGYYLDDGPGDSPPPDLDRLPDAEPKPEPLNRFANNPYVVFGREYVPDRAVKPFRQRGVASWYGRRFHGQKTSSGERYDMYAMTAAHPTLPIPSYARVTSVANGRSVVVRVNDRGPFLHNRVMDLSYAAAYKLGYVNQGSAMVEVEAIVPGEAPVLVASVATDAPARTEPSAAAAAAAPTPEVPPVAAESGGMYVQLGAFSGRDNAETFRARVSRELAWLDRSIEIFPKDGLFRLHVGPYRSRSEALAVADRIGIALDVKPHVVTR